MKTNSVRLQKALPFLAGIGIILISASGCSKEETQIALGRADCVVQIKTYENSSLKCATAFNELFPLIDRKQTTLNGTYVYWNTNGALNSQAGDTIYIYRMMSILHGFWSADTSVYFCVNDTKKDNHEYDLFQQYLKKGIKEESIDTP